MDNVQTYIPIHMHYDARESYARSVHVAERPTEFDIENNGSHSSSVSARLSLSMAMYSQCQTRPPIGSKTPANTEVRVPQGPQLSTRLRSSILCIM